MFSAKLSEAKKRGYDVYQVRKKSFQDSLKQVIQLRSDSWSEVVQCRIENKDLIEAKAKYHQTCNVNFRTHKQVPLAHGGQTIKKSGRPVDESKNIAFQKLVCYIKNHEGESFLMSELSTIMEKECDENVSFTNQYLKQKLMEHFGDELTIIKKNGCSDLVLFR